MPTLKDWIDGKWIDPCKEKEAPEAPSPPKKTADGYIELSDADVKKLEKLMAEKELTMEEALDEIITIAETPFPCDPPVLSSGAEITPKITYGPAWYDTNNNVVMVRNKNNDGWEEAVGFISTPIALLGLEITTEKE